MPGAPFIKLNSVAAPLLRHNIDTDAIIPSRETRSISRDGYGEKLFANWRYEPGTRIVKDDFILNRGEYKKAEILIAGRNFGCGSSREAATWALYQFGIKSVIAESFGSIFFNNSIRNGIVPVELSGDQITQIASDVEADPGHKLTIDLENCVVMTPTGACFDFSLKPRERQMLMSGLDEISMTLEHKVAIDSYFARDRAKRDWVYASIEVNE